MVAGRAARVGGEEPARHLQGADHASPTCSKSRMIAYPFRILMCCLVTDGGGALILTSAERAKDFPQKPVYILGTGESVETPMISQMEDFTSSRAFRVSGKKAFDEAGIKHKDVDHLMIYDAFAHLPLYGLEDLGFCKPRRGRGLHRRAQHGAGRQAAAQHQRRRPELHALRHVRHVRAAGERAPDARHRPGAGAGRQDLGRATASAACSPPAAPSCSATSGDESSAASGGRPMSYEAPFAGLKVVDLSQGVAGPYCGMLLAQHGADVIKVEPTGEGDWARTLGTRYGDHIRLFDPGQSRQALRRPRPEVGAGQGRAVAADRRRRRAARRLPPRRARPAGLRLRGGVAARAAHPLSVRIGLRPDRPALRPAGDGSGAAGLHRPDARQQGRGRHPASRAVRGHRHVDGAATPSRPCPPRCTHAATSRAAGASRSACCRRRAPCR